MSKNRETVVFGETPATSSKLNQLIKDYITPGSMIFDVNFEWDITFGVLVTPILYFGWWPYNPVKNVYDRLRVHWAYTNFGANVPTWEYSLDSNGSWNGFPASAGTGLPLSDPAITDVNSGAVDIPLDGITVFQHIGIRLNLGMPPNPTEVMANAKGYLWSTNDTPF